MTAILRWIMGILIAVAATLFALVNRHAIALTYSPFHPPLEMPAFLPVLAALAAGFVFGGVTVWVNGSFARRERRRQRKLIRALEKQLDETGSAEILVPEKING